MRWLQLAFGIFQATFTRSRFYGLRNWTRIISTSKPKPKPKSQSKPKPNLLSPNDFYITAESLKMHNYREIAIQKGIAYLQRGDDVVRIPQCPSSLVSSLEAGTWYNKISLSRNYGNAFRAYAGGHTDICVPPASRMFVDDHRCHADTQKRPQGSQVSRRFTQRFVNGLWTNCKHWEHFCI